MPIDKPLAHDLPLAPLPKPDLGEPIDKINQSIANVSNIFGGFTEAEADQSMLVNCLVRTRRQKIVMQISFESEVHDIYDPVFSSQESGSYDSSSTSSSSLSQDLMMKSELYDSENKSDLSSIHKDIAGSPRENFKEDLKKLDMGGCPGEEMWDDTVVNRCGRMLQKGAIETIREVDENRFADGENMINDESVIRLPRERSAEDHLLP